MAISDMGEEGNSRGKFFAVLMGVILTWIGYFELGRHLASYGLTKLILLHIVNFPGNFPGIVLSNFVFDGMGNFTVIGFSILFLIFLMEWTPGRYRSSRLLSTTAIGFIAGILSVLMITSIYYYVLHISFNEYGQSGVASGFLGAISGIGAATFWNARHRLRIQSLAEISAFSYITLFPSVLTLIVVFMASPAGVAEIAHGTAATIGFVLAILYARTREIGFVYHDPFPIPPKPHGHGAFLIVKEEGEKEEVNSA